MKRLIMLLTLGIVLIALATFMEIRLLHSATLKAEGGDVAPVPYDSGNLQSDFKIQDKDFTRFFRDDCVKTLTVKISTAEWDGMIKDMQAYSRIDDRMRTGNYRKADLIYEDRDGTITIPDVAIRTKGNTTRMLPQDAEGNYHRAHFKIKFDKPLGLEPGDEGYEDLKERDFMGLNAIILKANMWNDPSFIHEKFAYELLAKSGAKVPSISMTRLIFVIDGKEVNYGVYSMVEPIDIEYLKRRYGKQEADGNLYKCLWQNFGPATLEPITDRQAVGIKDWTRNYRPAYDLKTNQDKPDHKALIQFISKLNSLEGEELKNYLDQSFEVDSFLKFLACNVLLGMPDDYWAMGNNYYLYFNQHGKIEFLPYDYDQCLAAGWDGTDFGGYEGIANANILEWRNLAQSFTGQTVNHPLAEKILEIEAYRDRYLGYLKDYINPENNMFSYAQFLGLYSHVNKLYGPYMKNDTFESSSMTLSNEQWYFEEKIKSVTKQLESLPEKN